jgi:hypothetical protein
MGGPAELYHPFREVVHVVLDRLVDKSSCRAMNVALTFQCACLSCVRKSVASASRASRTSKIFDRVASGRSFRVLYIIAPSLNCELRFPSARPDALQEGEHHRDR